MPVRHARGAEDFPKIMLPVGDCALRLPFPRIPEEKLFVVIAARYGDMIPIHLSLLGPGRRRSVRFAAIGMLSPDSFATAENAHPPNHPAAVPGTFKLPLVRREGAK
jgi:hypothetical protein